jgi:hypothetical protein
MIEPVRKTITVPLDPASAFDLFTGGIARWWPVETHSLSGAAATVRVEPRVGGQVVETKPDGTEAPWARVTVWDPGRRFAVDWHVGRDDAEATQLDVTFTGTETGTRVDLVHDGFDSLAEGETMCARYRSGWDEVLDHCYGNACRKRAA